MMHANRVFILGAGFSKPAGMPLATELLPLLAERLELDNMRQWLDGLRQRLTWLSGADQVSSFKLNIEEVFHYAHFDVEVQRLRQHLAPVGRFDGPGTPWNSGETIKAWLSYLEEALRDVIVETEEEANLAPITRWAEALNDNDAIVTFNYDTLVERSLIRLGKTWNHGIAPEVEDGIVICKLHGSIDWIVAHRCDLPFSKLDLLFDKENANQSKQNTGHVEEDFRLWRCQTSEQLKEWISGRELQSIPEHASPRTVGIAGLGAYKQLHQIPGLWRAWANGLRALYDAEDAIVVGFSMSDFDAMAQMQFADVARKRHAEKRPLPVTVIDPRITDATKDRFRRVFRSVDFVSSHHETYDWNSH